MNMNSYEMIRDEIIDCVIDQMNDDPNADKDDIDRYLDGCIIAIIDDLQDYINEETSNMYNIIIEKMKL